MDCPICGRAMRSHFSTDTYRAVKCSNRKYRFIGLDLDKWEYPYSDTDCYPAIPARLGIHSDIRTAWRLHDNVE